MQITATKFFEAVGYEPENDDLERSNCERAGAIGHFCCGWDHARNLPRFVAIALDFKERRA